MECSSSHFSIISPSQILISTIQSFKLFFQRLQLWADIPVVRERENSVLTAVAVQTWEHSNKFLDSMLPPRRVFPYSVTPILFFIFHFLYILLSEIILFNYFRFVLLACRAQCIVGLEKDFVPIRFSSAFISVLGEIAEGLS